SGFDWSEVRLQKFERGIEPRFDGRDRAIENLGHLLELEALVDLQHHGLALVRAQPVKRARDGQAQFDRENRGPPHGNRVFRTLRLDLLYTALGPPLAEHGIGLVVRDAIKPGTEPPRVVEFPKILVRLQKNVLRQVQSVFTVTGDTQEIVIDTFLPS